MFPSFVRLFLEHTPILNRSLADFEVHVVDANKQPVRLHPDDVLVALMPPSGQEFRPDNVTRLASDVQLVQYRSAEVGQLRISVYVVGEEILGSPYNVKVVAAVTHGPSCILDISGMEQSTKSRPAYAIVTAKDQYGNLIMKGGAKFIGSVLEAEGIGKGRKMDLTDHRNGTYTLTLPGMSGHIKVGVTLDGLHLKESPFSVTVRSPDATKSILQRGRSNPVAGQPWAISVVTADRSGIPMSIGGAEVKATATLEGWGRSISLTVPVVDLGNGQYSINDQAVNDAGMYKVDILLDGVRLTGSPFDVEVDAGATDVSTCEVAGEGTKYSFDFKPASFVIFARDRFGNPRNAGGDRFDVEVAEKGSRMGGRCESRIEDNKNGTYTVTYGPVAGTQQIKVASGGVALRNSPFAPKPVALDPRRCTVLGEGASRARVGEMAQFVIETVDSTGTAIKTGGASIDAELWSDGDGAARPLRPEILDNQDGSYRASYLTTSAVRMTLAVKIKGVSVGNSPYTVDVVPGVIHPPSTLIEGEGLRHGFASTEATFTIRPVDAYGNKLTTGGEHFTVTLSEVDGSKPHQVVVRDTGDGSYTVIYPPINSDKLATVKHEDMVLLQDVHVAALDIDKSATIITAPPQSGHRVGEPVKVAVQTFDKQGRPMKTGGANFDAIIDDKLGGAIPVQVEDHKDGTYTLSYVPRSEGNNDIRVKLGDQLLDKGRFAVNVEAGLPHGPSSVALGDGLSRSYSFKPSTFTIHARDRFGSAIRTGGEVLEINMAALGRYGSRKDLHAIDEKNGQYLVHVPAAEGAQEISIRLKGAPVGKSPYRTVAVSLSASSCRLFGEGLSGTRVGEPADVFLETVDADGKPITVGGASIALRIEHPSGKTSVGVVSDRDDGSYALRYVSGEAGPHLMSVWLGDEKLANFSAPIREGRADAKASKVVGGGLSQSFSFRDSAFTIQARDRFGNPLTSGGDPFTVGIEPQAPEGSDLGFFSRLLGGAPSATVNDLKNGSYAVTYRNGGKCSSIKVSVSLDGAAVGKSPWDAQCYATDAANCRAFGDGLSRARAGEVAAFNVEVPALDKSGKKFAVGGAEVDVRIVGVASGTQIRPKVTDLGTARYLVEYNTSESGEYRVGVHVGDTACPSSPFSLRVVAGRADAALSRASGEGTSRVFSYRAAKLVIHAVDRFGNDASTGGEAFTCALNAPPSAHYDRGSLLVTDKRDGTYLVLLPAMQGAAEASNLRPRDTQIKRWFK